MSSWCTRLERKAWSKSKSLANTCFIFSRTFCFNIISFSCRHVLQHELAVLICLLCMFIFYWFILSSLSLSSPSFSSCLLSTSFNPNYPHVFLLHLTAPASLLMCLQQLLLPSWVPFIKVPNVKRPSYPVLWTITAWMIDQILFWLGFKDLLLM